MVRTEHTMSVNIGESQPIVTMVSSISHRGIGAGHRVDRWGGGGGGGGAFPAGGRGGGGR
eukprot:COSAG01_NODE_63238_length_280_cov_63.011050_1_plen_59_part_10